MAYSLRASASVTAFTLKKDTVHLNCCSDRVTLAMMQKMGPRPIPSVNAEADAAASTRCEYNFTLGFHITSVTEHPQQDKNIRL